MDENLLKKITDLIIETHSIFFIWRMLQNPEFNKGYSRYSYFWQILFSTLMKEYILNLYNLLHTPSARELSHKKNHTMSIHYLYNSEYNTNVKNADSIEYKIHSIINTKKFDKSFKKLKKWRDKHVAHKDVRLAIGDVKIHEKYPLKIHELQYLFYVLVRILKKTYSLRGDSRFIYIVGNMDTTAYRSTYLGSVLDSCENDTNFVINHGIFTKEYKKSNGITNLEILKYIR